MQGREREWCTPYQSEDPSPTIPPIDRVGIEQLRPIMSHPNTPPDDWGSVWGDWGCIVRDLETIIVLVLLVFNFIPPKVPPLTNLPNKVITMVSL